MMSHTCDGNIIMVKTANSPALVISLAQVDGDVHCDETDDLTVDYAGNCHEDGGNDDDVGAEQHGPEIEHDKVLAVSEIPGMVLTLWLAQPTHCPIHKQ